MTSTTAISKAVSVRNSDGLYDAQIIRECPSVFAAAAHESRSDRYNYIATKEILGALRQADFWPTEVMQSGSRLEGMGGFTKHLIRIRHKSDLGNMNRGDVFEIVLINSHNGTSTYQLMSGVFRMICSNGLIKGDVASRIRVQHSGRNELDAIIQATYKIAEEGPALMQSIQEMKQIQLPREEQLLLAKYAMYARFNLEDPTTAESNVVESTGYTLHRETDMLPVASATIPYEPANFLRRRRSDDAGNDLYTTLNVVQENVLKPGVRKYDKQGHKHSVRGVNGIDQNVKVNSLIFSFAEELKKLHQS